MIFKLKTSKETADTLSNAIRPTTTLITIMWANNEIGTINDISALCDVAHQNGVLFHTDATQISGKLSIKMEAIC